MTLRNRSGPISPRSNDATNMPSGRRASNRARFVFRIDSGRLCLEPDIPMCGATQASEAYMKHHFSPKFYLSGWIGPDGKLYCIRRVNGKLVADRKTPTGTGYVHDG